MMTMIGYEWVGVNRAWKNPEVRLERGVSAERERERERPGALTQRRRHAEFPAALPGVPFEGWRGL